MRCSAALVWCHAALRHPRCTARAAPPVLPRPYYPARAVSCVDPPAGGVPEDKLAAAATRLALQKRPILATTPRVILYPRPPYFVFVLVLVTVGKLVLLAVPDLVAAPDFVLLAVTAADLLGVMVRVRVRVEETVDVLDLVPDWVDVGVVVGAVGGGGEG